MKRSVFIILFSILFLIGCSSPSHDSTVDNNLSAQPSTPVSSISTYDDGVISCQYNDSLLSTSLYDIPEFSYSWLITESDVPEDQKSDLLLNGSCIYVVTAPNYKYGDKWNDLYESMPLMLTQAHFDGVFQRDSEAIFSITGPYKGCYEYSLSQSGYTFKGKFFSVTSDSITFIACRISDDLPFDVSNAFENCYKSVEYVSSASPQSSSHDDYIKELDRESEENADNAIEITEGDLYDSITAINPNVALYDMGDSLDISIYVSHSTYEGDVNLFFFTLSSACINCSLEDYYSTISFSMFVDDSYITTMTLINYTGLDSFSTSEPVVFKKEYKDCISDFYTSYFSAYDIGANFEKDLDSLAEKYGLTNQ